MSLSCSLSLLLLKCYCLISHLLSLLCKFLFSFSIHLFSSFLLYLPHFLFLNSFFFLPLNNQIKIKYTFSLFFLDSSDSILLTRSSIFSTSSNLFFSVSKNFFTSFYSQFAIIGLFIFTCCFSMLNLVPRIIFPKS